MKNSENAEFKKNDHHVALRRRTTGNCLLHKIENAHEHELMTLAISTLQAESGERIVSTEEAKVMKHMIVNSMFLQKR
jgi:hypothetical protein